MPSMGNQHLLAIQQAADRSDWEAVSNGLLELDPSTDGAEILAWSLQVLTQGDFQDSWQVAKVLPKLGDLAIEPLLSLLQNTELEPAAYWCVGKILGESQSLLVVEAVIEQLNQEPLPELAEILLRVLIDIGTPAIQQLTKLLTVATRHKSAVVALGKIRHSQTIEPLISVVNDPDPMLREIAIEALSSFHDVRVPPLLIKALTDPSSNLRQKAVVGLGMRSELAQELSLVNQLAPLLQDFSPPVYLATATALGRLGTGTAATVLADCYHRNTCPPDLKRQIVIAWGSIDHPLTISYLKEALWFADTATALIALRSLGQLKNQQPAVAQLLNEYIQNPTANSSPRLRQELLAVLGNMPDLLVVENIVQLLTDPDERVRWQAIYCLQQGGPKVLSLLQQYAQSPNTESALATSIQQCLTQLQPGS